MRRIFTCLSSGINTPNDCILYRLAAIQLCYCVDKKFDRFLRVFEIFAAHFMNGIFVESILCAQKGGKRREQIRYLMVFPFRCDKKQQRKEADLAHSSFTFCCPPKLPLDQPQDKCSHTCLVPRKSQLVFDNDALLC